MTVDPHLFNQITWTKLTLPRRRDQLLSRERLVDRFLDLLDYKLIIITAPAGYGKTTLLIDVAHQIDLPVCWYTVDPLDKDPQRFVSHFTASIARQFANFGRQSAAAVESAIQDNADVDRLVTIIVNELYHQVDEQFVFVLDDYYLAESKLISTFVNQFIQQVDENCHLIISSRALPNLSDLVLMVGRSQVEGLGMQELAFTAEEIQALALQNYNQTIPKETAAALSRQTEGWITGLLLSAQTQGQHFSDQLRLAQFSGVSLYDYLAQQVLAQQPPAVQDFLLRSSLLEEFDVDLCRAVLGPAEYATGEDWPDLIDTVVRNNLFVLPVDDDKTWLRYHHLFQDFLQAQIAAKYPAEQERIQRRLAQAWADRKAWEKAHQLFTGLSDVQAIVNLTEQAGVELVKQGRLALLARWIDALPTELATSRPALLSLRGIAAVTLGEVVRGISLLGQAKILAGKANNHAHLARVLVWRAVAYRFKGNYQASLADADAALQLTQQIKNLQDIQAEALRAKGMALYRLGYLKEAARWLEQALAMCESSDDKQIAMTLRLEIGITCSDAGYYDQALNHCRQALVHWQKTNNITWQANLLNSLGIIYHHKGNYNQASVTLEQALSQARQSGYVRQEAAALINIGDLYAELKAVDASLAAYKQARDLAQRVNDKFLLFYLYLAQAALARLQKNFSLAHDLLGLAHRVAQESASSYEGGLYMLEAGRVALAQNNADKAADYLQQAIQTFNQGGQRVEEIKSHLYCALAWKALKNKASALVHLDVVFNLASELESSHPLTVAGLDAKRLLKAVRKDPDLGSYACALLNQIAQFEQEIPSVRRQVRQQVSMVPFALPRLTVQALGTPQVFLNGQPVTSSQWQTQRRVREIFFYLLVHPEGVTREVIGATFWPNSSSRQLKLKLKNTIYRLRRALDKEVILFDPSEDLYMFNRQLDYEYDVEMFYQEIDRAEAAVDKAEQLEAYETAVDLYKGSYLADIDGTWAWPERQRLDRVYIQATLKLIEFRLELNDYSTALQYCQKILNEDPCLEEVHRQAMRAYAALGNRVAVIRQFRQCQQILQEELEVPVSPETKSLLDAIIGNKII